MGVGESVLDLFFPPACAACGGVLAGPGHFCEACGWEVLELPSARCRTCAEPGEFRSDLCPRCLARPPPFERVHAAFAHEGAVARVIHRFKYEDHPELASPLAQMLAESLGPVLKGSDAPTHVCALPLHPARRAERRFDQAELLAGALARRLGLRRLFLLERVRKTARQVGLAETAREENVAGAFRVRGRGRAGARSAEGLALLLVDDVVTTGATARAAAEALLGAGARSVQVAAVARAFTPRP